MLFNEEKYFPSSVSGEDMNRCKQIATGAILTPTKQSEPAYSHIRHLSCDNQNIAEASKDLLNLQPRPTDSKSLFRMYSEHQKLTNSINLSAIGDERNLAPATIPSDCRYSTRRKGSPSAPSKNEYPSDWIGSYSPSYGGKRHHPENINFFAEAAKATPEKLISISNPPSKISPEFIWNERYNGKSICETPKRIILQTNGKVRRKIFRNSNFLSSTPNINASGQFKRKNTAPELDSSEVIFDDDISWLIPESSIQTKQGFSHMTDQRGNKNIRFNMN